MLLSSNFAALLVSILLAISLSGVDGLPTSKPRSDDRLIHMPLTRSHNLARTDIHPLVLYQQHANRAHRRLARMTGSGGPSDLELRGKIEKRMFLLPNGVKSIKTDGAAVKRYVATGAVRSALDMLRSAPATKRYMATGSVRSALDKLRSASTTRAVDDATEDLTTALSGVYSTASDVGKRDLLSQVVSALGALGVDVDPAKVKAATAAAAAAAAKLGTAGTGRTANSTVTGSAASKSAATGSVASNSTATAGAAAGNSTATGTAAAGSGATAAGFSQVDLNAAMKGGLTASVVKDASATTGLSIEANDVGYIATIQIGTPPKDFRILMDSGSSDFWVGATACKDATSGAPCGNQHTFLGTTTSSTFVDSKKPFQVTYGSGAVAGTIITDDVTMAGLSLKTHTFGAASLESVQFSGNDIDFDGLMGLAQSVLSNQKVLTPPESLAKAGTIPSAITSFKISRLSDGKNDGQVTFGGLDTTKFDPATLVSVPNVSKTGFWETAVDAFTMNGKDLGLAGRTAIMDTGTTLIIAPPQDALAVHQAIPGAKSDGQGGFLIPCTTTASFAMTLGGKVFNIQPQDLTFVPANPKDLTGDCVSGISSGTIGGPQEWLVGDVALKNFYFSTDVTKNTLSFAKLV